jgi:hypothetical protein
MGGALRWIVIALIFVAALSPLVVCGDGSCDVGVDALWHGVGRAGIARDQQPVPARAVACGALRAPFRAPLTVAIGRAGIVAPALLTKGISLRI